MNKEAGNVQACASCRHQRKKCDETCELAPYFPANRYREFQNAHRLFGVSNILKIMSAVEPSQRQAAAESILMEGNARRNDPVHGCLGIIRNLKSQIEYYGKQLDIANHYLAFLREREKLEQQKQKLDDYLSTSPLASLPPLAPTALQLDQLDRFKSLTPLLPHDLPSEYIGDMKNSEDEYNYQSTLDEAGDVKPFDIQPVVQMLESNYQQENIITSFRGPAESCSTLAKDHGQQPLERVGEGDTQNEAGSSTKGKDDRDFKDE